MSCVRPWASPGLLYLGASYGTFLGAMYAELYPAKVGRLVLDGGVDPAFDKRQRTLGQAEGFETALRAYVTDCVDSGDCFLGDTVDDGLDRISVLPRGGRRGAAGQPRAGASSPRGWHSSGS